MEYLLSLGATRWEATKALMQRCVRTALTPIVNQLNVVGIVSIPGMMTGQILGGSDPSVVSAPRQTSAAASSNKLCTATESEWCRVFHGGCAKANKHRCSSAVLYTNVPL